MTWADARGELKTVLEGLTISSPSNIDMEAVYEKPPGGAPTAPAAVIFAPSRSGESSGGEVDAVYRVPVVFLAANANAVDRVEIADEFAEAIIHLFETMPNLTLNGTITTVDAPPDIDEPGLMEYAGRAYVGFIARIPLRLITYF